MRTLPAKDPSRQRRVAAPTSQFRGGLDAPELTADERRRVDLAALVLLEREHVCRLAQIRADREALLAQLKGAA